MLQLFETMSKQCCNTVSLRIVSCNITLNAMLNLSIAIAKVATGANKESLSQALRQ